MQLKEASFHTITFEQNLRNLYNLIAASALYLNENSIDNRQ